MGATKNNVHFLRSLSLLPKPITSFLRVLLVCNKLPNIIASHYVNGNQHIFPSFFKRVN